ncbi:geranylgeranyl transferase type-2 subunit alpha [Schistocerca americana]|uniref:geranylgeranyl transferase type-2 subunit alpha n=1 Tax=Schistocerca americana TaxID=7009 RepID=UPI001F4F764D|nr:geranylgeranyl transferase type-2 subunit alpha [Schistocerca americana]
MHGRVKTRTTAEQQEIKRKEREKKVKLYRAGMEKVFRKRKNDELDEELLEAIGQLLTANPDIYTLWNIRRETLLHFQEFRSKDQMQQLMETELQLTERTLHVNPKSYGAWHHRAWVLDNMPESNWSRELALCNKYLDMDERNFHTWHYRQFVVSRANISPTKEFEFTSAKITTNFSNYSSWHYRSRLLPLLYPDPTSRRPIQENKHKEELELVQNAAFTDPNDQSAWFYQRWLLGRGKQPFIVQNAFVSRDIIFITMSQEVSLADVELKLIINGTTAQGAWHSSDGNVYSHLWIFSPSSEMYHGDVILSEVAVQVMEKNTTHSIHVPLVIDGDLAWTSTESQFGLQFSEGLTSVLEEELDSCAQLLELEPDSKWTLLTSILLMQAIDRHKYREATMEKLQLLSRVDPLRSGYYNDLRSRYLMEYAVDANQTAVKSALPKEINLSNSSLTALYHVHHLSLFRNVDLSCNMLKLSLAKLHLLQNCQVLKLDNNCINTLAAFPELRQLKELSLQNNEITGSEELKYLKKCRKLNSVDLSGNPIMENDDNNLPKIAKEAVPSLQKLNGFLI